MATIIVGKKDIGTKPILVFMHGYAATCALYFAIFKRLSEKFVIICVDHCGMGTSSRPDGHYKIHQEPQQSLDYFVDSIELWRLKFSEQFRINMSRFYLVAHSFGAYVCGHYALKHPDLIEKLILLSPLGVPVTIADID
jgi:cardiolipin-specific phospholipase